MARTKRLRPDELQAYFARFTARFVREDAEDTVTIELLSPISGDQTEIADAPLRGIRWDPAHRVLDVSLQDVDRLAFSPRDVYVIEEDDGFVSAIEIVHDDDVKEIVRIRRPAPLVPASP